MREHSVLNVDIFLVVASVTLVTMGVLFIYSSGVTSNGDSISGEWIRQLVWAGIGMILLFALAFLDYSRLRDWSVYIYGAALAALIGTLLFGRVVNGSRSWIGIGDLGVQPSEFAKIAVIVLLARYLESRRSSVRSLATFAGALAVAGVPMLLILAQPDLGTALVYVPICLVMAFVAGVRPSYILFVIGAGLLLIIFAVMPAWEQHIVGHDVAFVRVLTDSKLFVIGVAAFSVTGALGLVGVFALKRRYFGWVTYAAGIVLVGLLGSVVVREVLQDYQLMRLIIFLNPNIDPRGAGWNIIQSVTAVGSGGLSGKGWLSGTQSHLQYLPQQSTDFIFSILAEEWGFLGVLGVFAAYGLLLIRGLAVSAKAKDGFAVYVGSGIVAMLFFHVAVNVGMTIGIMPITGIPLPFLSYGGSSLLTALICVGILMSIYQHRYRY